MTNMWQVVAFCEKESHSPTILRLQKLLKENGKSTENLLKALEAGQAADIITERIVQKKAERSELEKQLAEATMQYPILTVSQVKFFFDRFKKGDVNDPKYRKALIDTFVRKIILYDDKMTILFNVQDGHSSLSLEPECFSKDQLVEARGVELAEYAFQRVYCLLTRAILSGTQPCHFLSRINEFHSLSARPEA